MLRPGAVGADGKDRDISLLRHGQRVLPRVLTPVVLSIANHDNHAAQIRLRRWEEVQFLLAGIENRVVEAGNASGLQSADGSSEFLHIVSVILHHF